MPLLESWSLLSSLSHQVSLSTSLSCLTPSMSLKDTCDYVGSTWVIQDDFHLSMSLNQTSSLPAMRECICISVSHLTRPPVPLSYEGMHLQVLGIRMQTSLRRTIHSINYITLEITMCKVYKTVSAHTKQFSSSLHSAPPQLFPPLCLMQTTAQPSSETPWY